VFYEFLDNFRHNLFKPLLLFFYMGFSISLLRVPFEFPKVIYQGLTMYLLIAIGWHGGEELALLDSAGVYQALGFMLIGFVVNFAIGCLAYAALRWFTRIRNVDAATVAGYYGSDSAGTFVTCLGVLAAANLTYAAYMPVMLAVMEIPGCLVALFLVARLRRLGLDARGYMPGEKGYSPVIRRHEEPSPMVASETVEEADELLHNGGGTVTKVAVRRKKVSTVGHAAAEHSQEDGTALFASGKLLREVFLNPGLFLLFAGIVIGYLSRLQGESAVRDNDFLFVTLFQGALCLFLLEMGMTACSRLGDLKNGGLRFILFALIAPNVFAMIGITVAHIYSMVLGQPFDVGTYALFAVLCAAASYIAVPAVQRLAIPEASPTLPLAASLGLTFTYNVTIGIPLYIQIAKAVISSFPV
jgi:uncharacterized protein